MKIKSIKDIEGMMPGLPKSGKYRAVVKRAIEAGAEIEIFEAEPWTYYEGKNGRPYKYLMRSGDLSIKFCSVRKISTFATEENLRERPEMYREVSEKVGAWQGKERTPMYSVEMWDADVPGWGQIGRCIGKVCKEKFIKFDACYKCGGSGKLPHYAHIDNGVCFACMGIGRFPKSAKSKKV